MWRTLLDQISNWTIHPMSGTHLLVGTHIQGILKWEAFTFRLLFYTLPAKFVYCLVSTQRPVLWVQIHSITGQSLLECKEFDSVYLTPPLLPWSDVRKLELVSWVLCPAARQGPRGFSDLWTFRHHCEYLKSWIWSQGVQSLHIAFSSGPRERGVPACPSGDCPNLKGGKMELKTGLL